MFANQKLITFREESQKAFLSREVAFDFKIQTLKEKIKMRNIVLVIMASLLLGVSINAQNEVAKNTSVSNQIETKKKPFRPTKPQITAAQEKLKTAGTYTGATDGKYNNDFRAALRKYQEANGLEKSGKLDEATIEKMGIELTDSQKGIETADTSGDKTKRTSFRPTKDQLSQVQKMFKEKGTYAGEATGKYDDALRAAIKDFQSANGLKKTGSLNRATLEKMGITLTEAQAAIPANPNDLASGDDGGDTKKRGAVFRATKEQITEVQEKLKAANLYKGETDGKFNDDFRDAIKEWQKANNVKATGTLNKETLEAMGIELTDKQKEL